MEAITPHALRKIRSLVRTTRAVYAAKRRAVLAMPRQPRHKREEALADTWEARFWYYDALRRLMRAESMPCAKGANISPAARARALASGRWKRD